MNLVRAEVERLTARRFVQLMAVLLLAAFAITVVTTLATSRQPSAAEIERAQQRVTVRVNEMRRSYERCLAIGMDTETSAPRAGHPIRCETLNPDDPANRPKLSEFLYGVFFFDPQIQPLLYFLIAFLALFGFLVGASYLGADLSSGGMTNLLLWRPQRATVLGTKLGTLLGAVLALSVVSTVLYVGTFWGIATVSGVTGDPSAHFWGGLAVIWFRGLVLVLLTTALGFALASLGRHTAAALGGVAAYLVLWEIGARIVLDIADAYRQDMWMLSTYVGAWMAGKVEFWDDTFCYLDGCNGRYVLTWRSGLAVLLVLVGTLVAAAFANFRRRDLI